MIKQAFAAQFDPITGFGPFQPANLSSPGSTFDLFFSISLGVLTVVGGIAFLVYFVLGAFSWLTSAGDKEKVAKAQRYITNALIGLIVIVLAWAITGIVGTLLGFSILDLPGLIEQVRPI